MNSILVSRILITILQVTPNKKQVVIFGKEVFAMLKEDNSGVSTHIRDEKVSVELQQTMRETLVLKLNPSEEDYLRDLEDH